MSQHGLKRSVGETLMTISALRRLCLALPHAPTPYEARQLQRFQRLHQDVAPLNTADIEPLRAGLRHCWRHGDAKALREMIARIPADLLARDRWLQSFAVAASGCLLLAVESSPDGRWSLTIDSSSGAHPALYAIFRCTDGRYMGVPFGYAVDSSDLEIRWDLPDKVCGVSIKGKCYLLFRYGAGRRRNREHYRISPAPPFSDEEIAGICSRRPQRRQSLCNGRRAPDLG